MRVWTRFWAPYMLDPSPFIIVYLNSFWERSWLVWVHYWWWNPGKTPLNKAPNKREKEGTKERTQVRAKRTQPKGSCIIALCEQHNKLYGAQGRFSGDKHCVSNNNGKFSNFFNFFKFFLGCFDFIEFSGWHKCCKSEGNKKFISIIFNNSSLWFELLCKVPCHM